MERESKIFGIGLSKTGTTSLARALKMLGYKTYHFPKDLEGALEHYQALTDTPIARAYKDLDQQYPNSKFILTIRDVESWLKSMKAHFATYPRETREGWILELRRDLYHSENFDPALMKDAFLQHNESVRSHFKTRPRDLLIINIIEGKGWELLCPFLSKSIPDTLFPTINITENKTDNEKKL